jgi:hypothetical protein
MIAVQFDRCVNGQPVSHYAQECPHYAQLHGVYPPCVCLWPECWVYVPLARCTRSRSVWDGGQHACRHIGEPRANDIDYIIISSCCACLQSIMMAELHLSCKPWARCSRWWRLSTHNDLLILPYGNGEIPKFRLLSHTQTSRSCVGLG